MNLKPLFFDAFASRPQPAAAQLIRPGMDPHEGEPLRAFLAAVRVEELAAGDIRTRIAANLWMLTGDAFRYFLPAFMHAALASYESVSVFAAELVGALTEPSRADVEDAFDQAAQIPPGLGLPDDITSQLRKQQLEWFDSGAPQALFHERVDSLSPAEGAAVLAFFEALQAARGGDFPFGELEAAIDRRWSRYRAA